MKKLLVLLFCVSITTSWGKDYLALSKNLAKLRTEVEQLNDSVQEVRGKYTSELRSYSMQQAEMGATIRKEEIKKKQFQDKIARLQKQIKKNDSNQQDLNPIVSTYIEKLHTYIIRSLPYKKEERLKNLENLKAELANGEIRSQQALSRLWSAYEDEQRLTKENQISKEQIRLDGKLYLAEVAKLGSLSIFFRLDNGLYGKAVKNDQEWTFVTFDNEDQNQAGKTLFEGLKKQIKTAEYQIPHAFKISLKETK